MVGATASTFLMLVAIPALRQSSDHNTPSKMNNIVSKACLRQHILFLLLLIVGALLSDFLLDRAEIRAKLYRQGILQNVVKPVERTVNSYQLTNRNALTPVRQWRI